MPDYRYFAITLAVTLGLAVGLGSCGVGEPTEPSGNATSMRLKSITAGDMKILTVSYDKKGRMTAISRTGKIDLTFTYANSSSIPTEVKSISYNVHEGTVYEEETETWTNIKANDRGHLTSFDVHGVHRRPDIQVSHLSGAEELTFNTMTEDYSTTMSYDVAGHLLLMDKGNGDFIRYDWEGDLLRGITTASESSAETYCSYSGTANVNLQWDPLFEPRGPYMMTGLFGVAPGYFLSKQVIKEGNGRQEKVQIAYQILDNGLIGCAARNTGSDATTIFNYNYESGR